ncbi:MAG: hypothetical protein IKC08_09685, partial [Lentisphaeria bacterium]|nr:hypothetical protein [Lentisphaeria bacterium]
MSRNPVILFLVCLTAFSVWAKEYRLTDNGKIVSHVVISKKASAAEQHAAKELAVYLAKISKAAKPVMPGPVAKKGKYNIYPVLVSNDNMVKKSGVDVKKLT